MLFKAKQMPFAIKKKSQQNSFVLLKELPNMN